MKLFANFFASRSSSRIDQSSATLRRLPCVNVRLYDLERERFSESVENGLPIPIEPECLNLEFRLEARNMTGETVCVGTIDYIAGLRVTVRDIETPPRHQRQGYATAVLVWLHENFLSTPIVPMDERNTGLPFWAAMRARAPTCRFIGHETNFTDVTQRLRSARLGRRTEIEGRKLQSKDGVGSAFHSRSERFEMFLSRLVYSAPASDRDEALNLMRRTMEAVETEALGCGSPSQEVMRVYGWEFGWKDLDGDPCYWDDFNAKVHRTEIYESGRIVIVRLRKPSCVLLDKSGRAQGGLNSGDYL